MGEIIKANLDLRNIIFIFLNQTVFDLRTIHVRGRSQTTFTRGSGYLGSPEMSCFCQRL